MVKRLPRKKVVPHYWLFLIIFLFLIIGAVKSWQMVKGSHWDGKSRINLALSSELVCLASFSPKEEELMFLTIPQGTELEVISGYGKYRVEAVVKLEEQEKREGLLAESLQENLGVPVEGWIKAMIDGQWLMVNEDAKGELLKEIQRQIVGQGETNLTKWDLLRLWWQVRTLRFNRVESVDLSKISVLLRSSLPDGTQIWEIDKASLDAYLGKTLNDRDIRGESLGVEVLNGTSYPGLAERAARLLTNIGGEVVWVGNSDIKYQISNIKSLKSKRSSYTVQRIMKIFNAEWEEKKEEGRAELTLILGEDYWQKLNQK